MIWENYVFRVGSLILALVLIFILKNEDAQVPQETSIPSAIVFIIYILVNIQSIYIYGMTEQYYYLYDIFISCINATLWILISKYRNCK